MILKKYLQRLHDARVKANKQHYFCAFYAITYPLFLSCVYYLLYLLSLDNLNGQRIFSPSILFVLFHWAYVKWIKESLGITERKKTRIKSNDKQESQQTSDKRDIIG